MQASILPKRADHEAQKLGFLPLTSVAAFFEQHSAGCGVAGRHSAARAAAGRLGDDRAAAGRCPAKRHVAGRHSSTSSVNRAAFGRPRRYRAAFGHSWVPKRPFIARQRIACPNIAQNRREHPGFARLRRGAQLGSARQRRGAQPAIVRHSVRHSAQLTFAGIRPLQQKSRNIIPVFVLCNADSVIGCFSSMSGYLSGHFTYNAPLNEKTHKRSV